MYLVHCYVSVFFFFNKRRVGSLPPGSQFREDWAKIVGFFIQGWQNGLLECSSGPKAESTVDPKELGWQAATLAAATPDALVKN
jgi:hypothetical protein